jgi:hypothetical protein
MNSKKVILLIAINLIPLAILLFHFDDLYQIFFDKKQDYPFGSEFFSPFSIYRSIYVYVSFTVCSIIAVCGLILTSIYSKWRWYFILLGVNILLVLYPMFTNEWVSVKVARTHNSGFKKLAVQWLNEALCFVSSVVLADSFVLRNRQLLKPPKRYRQAYRTDYQKLKLNKLSNGQTKYFNTLKST